VAGGVTQRAGEETQCLQSGRQQLTVMFTGNTYFADSYAVALAVSLCVEISCCMCGRSSCCCTQCVQRLLQFAMQLAAQDQVVNVRMKVCVYASRQKTSPLVEGLANI
jgi:hypothetical protein